MQLQLQPAQPMAVAVAEPVFIHLLGTPRVKLPGGTELALERKDAALIAMLAREGPSIPARLAEWLWPDTPATQARTNLRQRLYRLRHQAADVVISSGGVHKLASGVGIDIAAIDTTLRADSSALAGAFLGAHQYGDCDALDQWVQAQRERWRAERMDALAALANEFESQQRIDAALQYAQRLIVEEPLLEHGYRRLMRLHHRRGDRAAMLAVYEACAQALRSELGEAPSEETRALVTALSKASQAPTLLSRPVPEALKRPPRLVGRDAAWRLLSTAWAKGSAVLLTADAGIGKTRLIEEWLAVQPRMLAQAGYCGDDRAPYALAARLLADLRAQHGLPTIDPAYRALLARLAPSLDAAPTGAASPSDQHLGAIEPAALKVAFEEALRAWHAAGLEAVVIDDLHFADAASLDLLLPIAAGGIKGLRWLLATRPHQLAPALSSWTDGALEGIVTSIRLQALDAVAVEALLGSLALGIDDAGAWVESLLAHSGGNPLLLLATLTALHADRPAGLGEPPPQLPRAQALVDLLQPRLRGLSAEALHLAQVAALAQQDFNADLAAAVLRSSLPALGKPWRELEDADVLRGTTFSHDLVRDALLSVIPSPLVAALHRAIARWLAAEGAAPARIGEHWWQCQDWPHAAAAFEAAAEQARIMSRPVEELSLLKRAAEAYDKHIAPEAAQRCRWRAVHVGLIADEIKQVLIDATSLVQSAASAIDRAWALEARSRVLNEMTRCQEALDDVTEARASVARMQTPPPEEWVVRLAQREGRALINLGRREHALEVLASARDIVQGIADEDVKLLWRCDLAMALDYNDRLEEAIAEFDAIASDALARERWTQANEALGNQAVTLISLGRVNRSCEASLRAIELSRKAGSERGGVLIDEATLATTWRDLGHFADALDLGERAANELRQRGHSAWALNAENDLAITYWWLGRMDLARRSLRPVPEDAPHWAQGARLLISARLDAALGRPVGDRVDQAMRLFAGIGRSYVQLKLRLELARTKPAAEAAQQAVEIAEQAQTIQQFGLTGQALTLQVDGLLRSDQRGAAANAAHRLLDHQSRYEAVAMYAAEPCWLAFQALSAAGADAAAREALGKGLQWINDFALPHVPAHFRDSFLQRNPANRGLLAAKASYP